MERLVRGAARAAHLAVGGDERPGTAEERARSRRVAVAQRVQEARFDQGPQPAPIRGGSAIVASQSQSAVIVEQDATWPGDEQVSRVVSVSRVQGSKIASVIRYPDRATALTEAGLDATGEASAR